MPHSRHNTVYGNMEDMISCNEAYFVLGQVCNTTQGFGESIHSLSSHITPAVCVSLFPLEL